MKHRNDTIAAIATAPGKAGISIVRVSGPESLSIADRLFIGRRPSTMRANSFAYGQIRNEGSGEILDEAILLVYRSPSSYTTEDLVEIQVHGGAMSSGRILDQVIQAGARPAESGEFTKRAFLNGRIDLVQAEAVADLICSRTERSAAAAIEQIKGSVSDRIANIYGDTIKLCANMEAALDFDEYDIPPIQWPELGHSIRGIRCDLDRLLKTWHEGHLLRDGALVVICGLPNAGKSTLLNSLLGIDRAIVNERPGTTRDTVEEEFSVDGIPVRLVDTAGLRVSDCRIEQDGIKRAEDFVRRADMVLYVIDASQGIREEDKATLQYCKKECTVIVANKTDLGDIISPADVEGRSVVRCSLRNDRNVEQIKSALSSTLQIANLPEDKVTISARHKTHINNALDAVKQCEALLDDHQEQQLVFAISYLRETAEQIGLILGKTYHTELLDSIFSCFCLGK
ncbi:MAG: tRNA uridine-5-carboxymethylaminomethyl(34) synthesis GTPase MnmE [Verrucomicrobiota bacterium]